MEQRLDSISEQAEERIEALQIEVRKARTTKEALEKTSKLLEYRVLSEKAELHKNIEFLLQGSEEQQQALRSKHDAIQGMELAIQEINNIIEGDD